ncbi:glycosyltransferase [Aliiglaciecola lipolytica]|uniref:Uncharacterized protein n=1 Tax=Aliiglaciecola lipolytica E3 TaxID=1127673 RepID=K6YEN1_9ALTE|nr:glycosyltransferase [Aliiglaciecola lipolytica]GAC15098.1 hypothetical protein GLIP_2472 [Aliiglaciecola lipolytica E3]
MLKIAAFPSEDKGNPYIENFYSALCDEEIVTVPTKGAAQDWLKNNIEDYDVAHFHWLIDFYNNESWKICFNHALRFIRTLIFLKKNKKKILFTLHNTFPHESRSRFIDWLVRFFILHLCDCVIVHSKSAKRQLAYLFGKFSNTVVMYHGHYKENYSNLVDSTAARTKLNIKPNEKVILFLGAIRPYKGVIELVEAFQKLKSSKLKLLIAGSLKPSLFGSNLEGKIGKDNRILFHNKFIEDEDLQTFFNASDLVVLPFRNSLTSGSLLLSYTFNKPVLVPNISSLKEYEILDLTYTIDSDLELSISKTLESLTTPDKSIVDLEMSKYNWDSVILPVKRKLKHLGWHQQ